MAFAQVKFFQTWKIAAFSVAFFSSFFSYSIDDIEKVNSTFTNENMNYWTCIPGGEISAVSEGDDPREACKSNAVAGYLADSPHCEPQFHGWSGYVGSVSYKIDRGSYCDEIRTGASFEVKVIYSYSAPNEIEECDKPLFPFGPRDHFCFKSIQDLDDFSTLQQDLLDEQNQLDKNDDYCKGLSMDSGNNTANTVCYSAPNGSQCSMSKQSGNDYSYYSGTGTETLGCGSSENPPYDSSGTGSEKDDCIFTGGTNYCKANEDKHCKTINGTKICDDGCIDTGNGVMCDASRHEDVGEGESDYFSDNGTCSVVHASSSKGACEDFGGVWDENGSDWMETSCPIGSGTCSTGSSFCGSCMDEGGVWTPDPINTQTERDGINDVAVRIEKSNEKLSSIEMTTRKTNEALISATKSGDGKLLAAIEELTKLTKDNNKAVGVKSEEKEEKEKFTTTTNDTDNSGITALFNDASKLSLQADIDQLKLDTTAFINSARTEATALMTITVPSSSGYEVRNLTLTAGTFDVSFSRFSSFFILLSGPIMLICSIIAGFIILGGKD